MLYYRMAQARPFFRYATIVIGVVVLLNGIVMTFINIFQCHPVRAAFDLSTPGKCVDIVALYLCSAPVNVITDIAILVLPLPLVTAMRLDLRQKIGLIATFMAGIFVTIVDVVRIYFIQSALIQEIDNGQSVLQSSINGAGIPNFSWYTSYSFMWSAVEANVGLICACALVIKPLLLKILPGKSTDSSGEMSSADEATSRNTPPSSGQPEGFEGKTQAAATDSNTESTRNRAPSSSSKEVPLGLNVHDADEIRPIDEDREMGLAEFFATADALVVLPPARNPTSPTRRVRRLTSGSIMGHLKNWNLYGAPEEPPQQTPTTFMDFVNLGDKKPLTELTRKEAWWPVVFGECCS